MVPSPDLSLAAWLDAPDRVHLPIVQVMPADRALAPAPLWPRFRRMPRPVTPRVAPTLPFESLVIGACVALLPLAVRIGRELRLVDALAGGRVLTTTPAPGPCVPWWVSWRLATLRAERGSESGSPYRRGAPELVAFAPPDAARVALHRLASDAARVVFRAFVHLVFSLAVGVALGFCLARLLVQF